MRAVCCHCWLRWALPLLLLLLLCCCCIATAAAQRRRRLRLQASAAAADQGRFVAHVRDLLALPSTSMTPRPRSLPTKVRPDDLLRPDIVLQGGQPRRSSITGAMEQPPNAARRMRQLTMGNYVWPGRRAASMDDSHATRFMEMYSDGRPRAKGEMAYTHSMLRGSHSTRSLILQQQEDDEPRSVMLDGLFAAESRAAEDVSGSLLGLPLAMRARRHIQRLASDEYCQHERQAALAGTLVSHEEGDASVFGSSESVLSLMLRERCALSASPDKQFTD
jgi:hypothetical protein